MSGVGTGPHVWRWIALLWRAPLAAVSFLAYRVASALFRFAMQRYNRRHAPECLRWRVLSGDMLRIPLALPAVMTSGPRWNTHAIVATAGPLRVTRQLECDAVAARRSARSWTVVVSTFPAMRTVASLGCADHLDDQGSASFDLDPGEYWLGLRYYGLGGDVELPEVRVDGAATVPSKMLSPDVNEFYDGLLQRSSAFYLCLHYYVWVLLLYRDALPPGFVRREYVPLGNPDTEFFYGAMRKGESLIVDLADGVLEGHDVFLTLYTRSSFPLAWSVLAERASSFPPVDRPCTYLIRVKKRGPETADLAPEAVVVSVERAPARRV